MAIIAEASSIILNLLLLSLFYHQIQKNQTTIKQYRSHEAIRVTWSLLIVAFLFSVYVKDFLRICFNGQPRTDKTSKLLVIFRKITWLTVCAIFTTVIVTFGYINYKSFSMLISLDAVFNSFCVFLMLHFNQIIIRYCFCIDCNHCCCLKCDGFCRCRIICGEAAEIASEIACLKPPILAIKVKVYLKQQVKVV
eukprot:297165_1